ncbi:MAG: hypothetical protein JWO53_733 [Chlamydiia bacterium]|nr:hypothetical protein [Chlamydiia bacterium]
MSSSISSASSTSHSQQINENLTKIKDSCKRIARNVAQDASNFGKGCKNIAYQAYHEVADLGMYGRRIARLTAPYLNEKVVAILEIAVSTLPIALLYFQANLTLRIGLWAAYEISQIRSPILDQTLAIAFCLEAAQQISYIATKNLVSTAFVGGQHLLAAAIGTVLSICYYHRQKETQRKADEQAKALAAAAAPARAASGSTDASPISASGSRSVG